MEEQRENIVGCVARSSALARSRTICISSLASLLPSSLLLMSTKTVPLCLKYIFKIWGLLKPTHCFSSSHPKIMAWFGHMCGIGCPWDSASPAELSALHKLLGSWGAESEVVLDTQPHASYSGVAQFNLYALCVSFSINPFSPNIFHIRTFQNSKCIFFKHKALLTQCPLYFRDLFCHRVLCDDSWRDLRLSLFIHNSIKDGKWIKQK